MLHLQILGPVQLIKVLLIISVLSHYQQTTKSNLNSKALQMELKSVVEIQLIQTLVGTLNGFMHGILPHYIIGQVITLKLAQV